MNKCKNYIKTLLFKVDLSACIPMRQLFKEGADGFMVCVRSWLVCGHQCQSFVICKKINT